MENPEELAHFLAPLVKAGVDIFHCSTRRFWDPEFEGSDLNLAGWTKKLTGKPTITVGSIGLEGEFMSPLEKNSNIVGLVKGLERDEFDLVAIGRGLLADPAWADKIRDGRMDEIVPFSPETLKVLV